MSHPKAFQSDRNLNQRTTYNQIGGALSEEMMPVQAASLVNIKLCIWCETIAREACETLNLEDPEG